MQTLAAQPSAALHGNQQVSSNAPATTSSSHLVLTEQLGGGSLRACVEPGSSGVDSQPGQLTFANAELAAATRALDSMCLGAPGTDPQAQVALECATRALHTFTQQLPAHDMGIARAKQCAGTALLHLGRENEAYPHLEGALRMFEAQLPADDLEVAASKHSLALVMLGLNQIEAALQHEEDALRVRRRLLPPGHIDVANSEMSFAKVASLHDSQRGFCGEEAALPHYSEALRIYKVLLPAEHELLAHSELALAETLCDLQRCAEALPHYEEALRIFTVLRPAGDVNRVKDLTALKLDVSMCMLRAGKPEALVLAREAQRDIENTCGRDDARFKRCRQHKLECKKRFG